MPLGRFFNNSVHSSGGFGLWVDIFIIFLKFMINSLRTKIILKVFPQFTPTSSGQCWDTKPKVAQFTNFISYSNDKGAEFEGSNNLQFRNFLIWDQYSVGIETKTVGINQNVNTFQKDYMFNETMGATIANTIIVGNSLNSTSSYTKNGIIIAWDRGELWQNVSFYNFPNPNTSAILAPVLLNRCM
jgi:hypothetical protein